jgi:hypothetical protein
MIVKGGEMATIDFKKSWEEAVRKALLNRQLGSELADSTLTSAMGLPVRSDLKAGFGSIWTVNICARPHDQPTMGCI